MSTIEVKTNGTFYPVPGGYEQKINDHTKIFIPDFAAARYNALTGELWTIAPDYEAMEAAKAPAVEATAPGVYAYQYETQHAPTGCDFSADLAYYGKHYFLHPLRADLPRLHGRGITYDEQGDTYMVTLRAYEKIKAQYRIQHKMYFD